MPPQVRDLQELIRTQNAALQPQYDILDQNIQANESSGSAQVAGLDAAKTSAFGKINQDASNKGMFFSGFTPSEEAGYTASTYLPALAQLQNTIAQTRLSLLGKKADLGKGAFDVATQQQEEDRKVLADWNSKTRDQQFNASEAEKQRVFQANQNAQDRSAAAAGRAASQPSAGDQKKADVGAAHSFLQSVVGKDGRVSPTSYAQAKSLWGSLGYSAKEFDQNFASYRNPNNKNYKLG